MRDDFPLVKTPDRINTLDDVWANVCLLRSDMKRLKQCHSALSGDNERDLFAHWDAALGKMRRVLEGVKDAE